jgi:hypothetical protein
LHDTLPFCVRAYCERVFGNDKNNNLTAANVKNI